YDPAASNGRGRWIEYVRGVSLARQADTRQHRADHFQWTHTPVAGRDRDRYGAHQSAGWRQFIACELSRDQPGVLARPTARHHSVWFACPWRDEARANRRRIETRR